MIPNWPGLRPGQFGTIFWPIELGFPARIRSKTGPESRGTARNFYGSTIRTTIESVHPNGNTDPINNGSPRQIDL